MNDLPDNKEDAAAPDGTKAKALVATAELEQREFELKKKLGQMMEERRALEEILESLKEEEQILARRLELAKKERDRIAEAMDSKSQHDFKKLEQVEDLKREIGILERRCSENMAREKELDREITEAEKHVRSGRQQIYNIAEELEKGCETIARMDRKISLSSKTKR